MTVLQNYLRVTKGLILRPYPLERLPRWLSGKNPSANAEVLKFNPWVRKIPWRRKWKPTPVFFLEKSHGQRNLAGYPPWSHKESDVTQRLSTSTPQRLWFGHFWRLAQKPACLTSATWILMPVVHWSHFEKLWNKWVEGSKINGA